MDKKLKIAIIGSRGYPYVYSGYETLVKELSERLVKKGHKVRVYCHRSLFKKKPKQVNGIDLIYIPSIETKFLSQIISSFFSFVHVCFSNIDVILVVNSANGPYGILTKIFNKKTCINVDGLEWLRPKWKGIGSIYYRIASKMATIFFDEIITDSREMNKVYVNKYQKKSNTIAYGPTMVKNVDNIFLDNYSLEKNNYYLIVGRLIPDNNAKLIIEGFLNSASTKKMVIVGDVPYEDKYSKNVKSLESNKVIFTGYILNQVELSCLYENCFFYVHGHEFGGTNPTMINALFLNCKILALNTIFNSEMLEHRNCIFFEKNKNSIRQKILLAEKNYSKINKQQKNYSFPKKYDWDNIVNKYIKIFKEL